jgi:pyruvate-formate lyase-activating enzyme
MYHLLSQTHLFKCLSASISKNMPDKKIFCNVPWTNTHIYWDGGFGACCSEKTKPYTEAQSQQYNIKNMNIVQWYNSDAMKQMRNQIKSSDKLPQCRGCYHEEQHGYESRRIKENFKSVIFTEHNFDRSYQQSPGYVAFEHDGDAEMPVDWHVDLGNECNLACKMCNPNASSIVATQYKRWQLWDAPVNVTWTRDDAAWNRFLTDIVAIEKLNRVHFMGGEPAISKRFVEFLQYMIDHDRTDVSISFVTNGTIINDNLLDLLQRFRTFDIEVSIEAMSVNNHYIRQGSDTEQVKSNILYLKGLQSDKFHLILRSVPQLLNVNNYDQYIRWAWDQQLPVSGIPLTRPAHYAIAVLPSDLRERFIPQYQALTAFLRTQITDANRLYTGRSVSGLASQLIREAESVIAMLRSPEPSDVEQLRHELTADMMRWDTVYKLNALDFYPEYRDFFLKYGYIPH